MMTNMMLYDIPVRKEFNSLYASAVLGAGATTSYGVVPVANNQAGPTCYCEQDCLDYNDCCFDARDECNF
jgi:hypothetical protein